MKAEERIILTPVGEGRLVTRRAQRPIATLLLSHGAGGGIEARDLTALATYLPRQGVSVMLFEQPWRRAGRKVATPPATLDVGLRAAVDAIRVRTPIILGGRSAGARSACRSARALGAAGCLALSFPLHPPGKPEQLPSGRAGRCRGADPRDPGGQRPVRHAGGVSRPAARAH